MHRATRCRPRAAVLLTGLLVPAAGLLAWASPAAHASPARPTDQTGLSLVSLRPPLTITLQTGDTLWGLSETYGVPIPVLQAANGLGSSTLIYAGRSFVIPGRTVVASASTVAQVATRLGVDSAALADLNGLSSASLPPGRTLYVPGGPDAGGAPETASMVTDLAHLVEAEAGNQPFLGQVAVAAVVLNRVKAPGFPKTVPAVIFEPGQFEAVANGTYWMAPSQEAYAAAWAALQGQDPTDGALYYYNPSLPTNPWMKDLPVLVTIGSQVFCR